MIFKNIILTGFMGTGKSTVGKLLAKKLGYQFVDTDASIMDSCGKTILQIFQTHGETLFREMERNLALELGQKENLVISTGGGMMLDSANVDSLGKKGKIFCLVATPDDILARISADHTIERPLLKVQDPVARMTELLKERKEAYSQFIQVNTTGVAPEEVCKTIADMFKRYQLE